jgi:outer membrane protein TolC
MRAQAEPESMNVSPRPVAPALSCMTLFTLVSLGAFAAPAAAQLGRIADLSDWDPDSLMMETLRDIGGEPLGLSDAVARAMEQSTDARAAEEAFLAAAATVQRERGAFDPELFAAIERVGDEAPTASPFAGAEVLETESTHAAGGARIQLPFGTELEASVATDRLETNSAFAALNPEDAATSALRIRQPLLAGFGPGTRGQLTAAERRMEASRARFEATRAEVRSEVERTYWELYAAERDLAVQRLIVERAASILEEARLRAEAGLVGPNQVANAQVFHAEQQLTELDREESLNQVSDRLASLIARRPGSERRFHAADPPPAQFASPSDDELVAMAMERNPSLIAIRFDAESVHAEESAASWNALPSLDLVGSLGGHGLGGTPREVIFGADTTRTAIDGSISDAIGEAIGRDYPTWSFGVELTLPLFLREGRGERNRLRAEARRSDELVRDLEQQVEEAVRARAQELRNGSRRLELAREGMTAALEQVRIGVIEFQNGRTTAFELVRLGADLASSQERFSDALVRTASAAAELRALIGGELP